MLKIGPVYFKGRRIEEESEERRLVCGTVYVLGNVLLVMLRPQPTLTFQISETE